MHSYQPLGTDNMLLLTDYDFLDMQHFNIHRTPRFKIIFPPLSLTGIIASSQAVAKCADTCLKPVVQHFGNCCTPGS